MWWWNSGTLHFIIPYAAQEKNGFLLTTQNYLRERKGPPDSPFWLQPWQLGMPFLWTWSFIRTMRQSIIHCPALLCKWYVPWSHSPGRTAAPLEPRRQLRTEKTMLQIRPFFCSASASYTKKSTEVRWWPVEMVVLSAGKSSWAQGTGLVFRRTLHYGKSRTGFPAHQTPKSYAGSTHLQVGIVHCPLEVQSSPKEGKPSRGSPHAAPPLPWARALERQASQRGHRSLERHDTQRFNVRGHSGQTRPGGGQHTESTQICAG